MYADTKQYVVTRLCRLFWHMRLHMPFLLSVAPGIALRTGGRHLAETKVNPLTVVAIAIAVMIGDGCCTFVSISLGAKEPDNARRGVGSS